MLTRQVKLSNIDVCSWIKLSLFVNWWQNKRDIIVNLILNTFKPTQVLSVIEQVNQPEIDKNQLELYYDLELSVASTASLFNDSGTLSMHQMLFDLMQGQRALLWTNVLSYWNNLKLQQTELYDLATLILAAPSS